MEVTIREAGVEDFAEMARLMGELGYSATAEQLTSRWTQQDAGSFVLLASVADHFGGVAGMLMFARVPLLHADGFLGRVTGLVVDARVRGRGIGRRLLAAMEQRAWSRECLRVEITSGDHRPDAHAFYERTGYLPDERRFIRRRPAT